VEAFASPPLPDRTVGDGDEDDEADLDDAIASVVDRAPGDEDLNAAVSTAIDDASFDDGPTSAVAATFDDATSGGDEAEEAVPAPGARRRRRRNRGGRSTMAEGESVAPDEAPSSEDEVAPVFAAVSAPDHAKESAADSPAVLRRFDRGDWRSRLPGSTGRPSRSDAFAARLAAASPRNAAEEPAPRAGSFVAFTEPVAPPATDTSVVSAAPGARFSREAGAPSWNGDSTPEKTTDDRPSRFNDRGRGRDRDRDRERPAALTFENTTPPIDAPSAARPEQPAPANSPVVAPAAFTPTPASTIVTPYSAPPTSIVTPGSSSAPARGGEIFDERLERLLTNQSLMLAQQQQALASLTNTVVALQDTLTRLTTVGITANAPRTGVFVDAPNVIYAAENARVNLDYGKMLDFLGRGREIVHAIVYAPVTEDPGSRPENQRFVAPFLRRGYKMVTKPLKRFPDGTAKGNFDIELAIDIMTMSERLDVVVLLSGDSDFARLVQLVQSRGVRVEVASFASNVSWELVQMADVFMDLGQYVREFQET